jgi:hypothetical protein
LGDAYKNITICKKSSEYDNEQEKLDHNAFHIVKYSKLNIDSNVVGAYSMSRHLSNDRTDYFNRTDAEG